MQLDLEKLTSEALTEIQNAQDRKSLDILRIKYLGRKSQLIGYLKSLKNFSLDEKKEFGPFANSTKIKIESLINIKEKELINLFDSLNFDFSRPGVKFNYGHSHPITIIENEIINIYRTLNFSVILGNEIETEKYNFDFLNIPENHPAREMWDTFWIDSEESGIKNKKDRYLLRTHTSPMQVRYLEKIKPPLQIIVPGRVFRYEATDATHEINFYQVEGLMVGKDISIANFKYIIESFFTAFFKSKVDFRYRPSFFPFVEPGLEVDIKLPHGNWLEVMGAGMVHKKVFEAAGYKAHEWQGFAFGMGLDRLLMIKYGVPDVRLLYSGDLRLTKQF